MKILTEIKKTRCSDRFVLLVVLPGLISAFTACNDDDDSDIPVCSLKDVDGDYSGKILAETAPSVDPQNYSSKEEQPQGTTVTAEVKNNQTMIKKLPVDGLIRNIIDEEVTEAIIKDLDDTNYNIPYTTVFNDNGRGSILLQLKPGSLGIRYTPPTQVKADGEEDPQVTVKVTIEAEEQGQYTYKDEKLTFVIEATQVEVEGVPSKDFPIITFSFDIVRE